MDMILDLSNVPKEYHEKFCKYIIEQIKLGLEIDYKSNKAKVIEDYINNNKLIDWQYKDQFISVYDLYRLAVNNLDIKVVTPNKYLIKVNQYENIPNSYTNLHDIISLLEYGSLSVKRYGLLANIFSIIADNLSDYYKRFITEI